MLLADNFLTLYPWLPGVVVAVALTSAGWLINFRYRQRDRKSKTLDLRVISDLAILSHRPDDNELKVMYLNEELDHPRIVRVRFTNTGTEVIRAAEVLEPLVLTVTARVVSASVAEQSGRILETFSLTKPNPPACELQLPIATINRGDTFTLQMIIDSEEHPEFSLRGRIEGQTRPPGNERASDLGSMANSELVMGLFMAVMFTGFGTFLLFSMTGFAPLWVAIICTLPMMFGGVLGVRFVLGSFDLRRRAAAGDFASSDPIARGESLI